jgi:hypothetical protein
MKMIDIFPDPKEGHGQLRFGSYLRQSCKAIAAPRRFSAGALRHTG